MNIYALELHRLPNASLKIMLRLAKTLRRDKPQKTNVVIEEATEALDDMIELCHNVLVARLIAENPELQAGEIEYDHGVDGLWILLRKTLEGAEAYAHPGLDAMPPELAEKAGLAERREHARRARKLWERLFGAEGTAFTQAKLMVQAETMGTLLRMIEQEDLREELDAVVGKPLTRLIEHCQVHYEGMVDDRLSRKSGSAQNLNELRSELRWAIVAYVQAVHSLVKKKQPETSEMVLEALRAVLTLRESLARASSEAEADLDDLVELDLEGVEGVEQAAEAVEEAAETEG